jgi:hypothetical protein
MKSILKKKIAVETAIIPTLEPVAHVKRDLPLATTRHFPGPVPERIPNLTDIPLTDHAGFLAWWEGSRARLACQKIVNRYAEESFGLETELLEIAQEIVGAAKMSRSAFDTVRDRRIARAMELLNTLDPPPGLLSGAELDKAGREVFAGCGTI